MKVASQFVHDVMTTSFVSVSPDADIASAMHLMVEHDISGLLVVDDAGALTGILTERDCIAAASAAAYYQEWGGPVAKFMTAPVETVAPDDKIIDLVTRMADSRYRRFPVVENGSIVGVISRRDVLGAIAGDGYRTEVS